LARAGVVLVASACSTPSTGNGALGSAGFSYDCAADSAAPDRPELDAWCASPHDASAIPEVAVGAPFELRVADSGGTTLQPAVPSLATASPGGWTLTQAGWLGFLLWSGSDVLDFTHVHGEAVASLSWQAPPPLTLDAGASTTLSVVPRGADGGVLAGELPCDFASTDPSALAVTDHGRIATLTASASGKATITASCAGQQLVASFVIAGAGDGGAGGP
jgi:hypothetical protein